MYNNKVRLSRSQCGQNIVLEMSYNDAKARLRVIIFQIRIHSVGGHNSSFVRPTVTL